GINPPPRRTSKGYEKPTADASSLSPSRRSATHHAAMTASAVAPTSTTRVRRRSGRIARLPDATPEAVPRFVGPRRARAALQILRPGVARFVLELEALEGDGTVERRFGQPAIVLDRAVGHRERLRQILRLAAACPPRDIGGGQVAERTRIRNLDVDGFFKRLHAAVDVADRQVRETKHAERVRRPASDEILLDPRSCDPHVRGHGGR